MGAVNFIQRVIGKYAGQAVEVAGNIAVQILEFDGDIFSVQKDTVTVPSRTRISMPSFASLIKSIGFVSPIENAGTATDPIVGISPASGTDPGSMSAAHFTLVDGATSDPDPSTVALRDASSKLYAAQFAPQTTGIPSIGILAGPTNSTLVATVIAGNDAKAVESVASSLVYGDETMSTESRVAANQGGKVSLRLGSANRVEVTDDNASITTIETPSGSGRSMYLISDGDAALKSTAGSVYLLIGANPKIQVNGTGVGFNGAAPVGKLTDTWNASGMGVDEAHAVTSLANWMNSNGLGNITLT